MKEKGLLQIIEDRIKMLSKDGGCPEIVELNFVISKLDKTKTEGRKQQATLIIPTKSQDYIDGVNDMFVRFLKALDSEEAKE